MNTESLFICYRRDDSIAYAGRLHDRLAAEFGKNRVFMDVDTILPGEDFIEVVESRVSSSAALIAIIGRGWLDSKDDRGDRRLDDPADHVRREIAAALDQKIRVIPALVGGATMPRSTDLPADIAPLSRRNAIVISDTAFAASVAKLIEALKVAIDTDRIRRQTERADTLAATQRDLTPAPTAESTLAAIAIDGLPRANGESLIGNRSTTTQKYAAAAGAAALCLLLFAWLFSDHSSNDAAEPEVPSLAHLDTANPTDTPTTILPESTARQDAVAPVTQNTYSSMPTVRQLETSPQRHKEEATVSASGRRAPTATAAEVSRATPPAAARAPMRVGLDGIRHPVKTKDIAPQYPPLAVAARIQGTVIVEATIDPMGKVQDARVLESPNALLNAATLDAVRQWEFTPTLLNGVPVPVIMTLTVRFRLDNNRETVLQHLTLLEETSDVKRAAEMLMNVFGIVVTGGDPATTFASLRHFIRNATDDQLEQASNMIPTAN